MGAMNDFRKVPPGAVVEVAVTAVEVTTMASTSHADAYAHTALRDGGVRGLLGNILLASVLCDVQVLIYLRRGGGGCMPSAVTFDWFITGDVKTVRARISVLQYVRRGEDIIGTCQLIA